MAKYVSGSYWWYVPNKGAPIVFCVLFFISGVWHAFQTRKYRSWRFTLAMPWSAILMIAGFALREVGAYHPNNLPILITSQVLVMSGPPIYAVTDYLVLSRILFYIPYLAPLHPGRVITTFLALDAVTEAIIVNGASRVANTKATETARRVGGGLIKAGLILQAVCFVLFVSLAAHFHIKAKRMGVLSRNIKTALIILYTSAVIITIRCIYRIVEYFEGYTGSMNHTEVYFYIFEAAFMWANTLMLNIWHPGKYLPPNNHVFLSKDGKTELHGPGWKDDRNFFATFFDPFDIVGLIKGNDKKTRFWDMEPAELEAFCQAEKERRRRKKWWDRTLLGRFILKRRAAKERSGSIATADAIPLRDKNTIAQATREI